MMAQLQRAYYMHICVVSNGNPVNRLFHVLFALCQYFRIFNHHMTDNWEIFVLIDLTTNYNLSFLLLLQIQSLAQRKETATSNESFSLLEFTIPSNAVTILKLRSYRLLNRKSSLYDFLPHVRTSLVHFPSTIKNIPNWLRNSY